MFWPVPHSAIGNGVSKVKLSASRVQLTCVFQLAMIVHLVTLLVLSNVRFSEASVDPYNVCHPLLPANSAYCKWSSSVSQDNCPWSVTGVVLNSCQVNGLSTEAGVSVHSRNTILPMYNPFSNTLLGGVAKSAFSALTWAVYWAVQ